MPIMLWSLIKAITAIINKEVNKEQGILIKKIKTINKQEINHSDKTKINKDRIKLIEPKIENKKKKKAVLIL